MMRKTREYDKQGFGGESGEIPFRKTKNSVGRFCVPSAYLGSAFFRFFSFSPFRRINKLPGIRQAWNSDPPICIIPSLRFERNHTRVIFRVALGDGGIYPKRDLSNAAFISRVHIREGT
jgi:hypothetical protein